MAVDTSLHGRLLKARGAIQLDGQARLFTQHNVVRHAKRYVDGGRYFLHRPDLHLGLGRCGGQDLSPHER